MGEARPYEYEAVSIPSFESLPVQSSSSTVVANEVEITRDMVLRLGCETEAGVYGKELDNVQHIAPIPTGDDYEEFESANTIDNDLETANPQRMIIYEGGDIDCALHFVMESLHYPFVADAVATVLVEERIRDSFVKRVSTRMHPLTSKVATNPRYLNTLNVLQTQNIEIIEMNKNAFPCSMSSPIMVCNCVHSVLGKGITGVISMHSFCSTMKAVDICRRDAKQYSTTSVWNESIEGIYQLAASINCSTFYFNCNHVCLKPISEFVAENKKAACVANNYHYETLKIFDRMKIIVFPIGAHLMQPEDATEIKVTLPIEYLNE